jgi:hypothetical protein
MKLLRDAWLPIFQKSRELEKRIGWDDPRKMSRKERGMVADYRASEVLMTISETIVLPSSVMLDLIHNLDRIDTRGWIKLPYPYVTIQFTHPIPEKDIMAHVEINDLMRSNLIPEDFVSGIIVGNADQDQKPFPPEHVFNMMNCCILFQSTSVNRVAWLGTDKPSVPYWHVSEFQEMEFPAEQLENKQRMIQLCYAINLFLNAPNVIVVKQRPDAKLQKAREKKGKPRLPEYHTVTIEKVQTVYEEPNKGSGTPHTRMYPVRGHFRKLKQFADPIWVPNHFRGLKHGEETMLRDVYRVPPRKPQSPR